MLILQQCTVSQVYQTMSILRQCTVSQLYQSMLILQQLEHIGRLARMSASDTEVDGSNPGSSMLFP